MSTPLQVFKAPLEGISLVEASAGTGKTYNITSLYVRAVLEKGLIPSQILVMTYTEAATAELKLRIRNRLKESLAIIESGEAGEDIFYTDLLAQQYQEAKEKLEHAIEQFDEAAIFTIHGFCTRVLTEYSLQFGIAPKFDLLTDKSEVLQDCVDSYWRAFIQDAETDSDTYFVLDYLTDINFGPDELRLILDRILSHPYAEIVPAGLKISELANQATALKDIFMEVQHCWKKEKEAFQELYFSGWLSGTYYKKDKHQEDWDNFVNWVEGEKVSINYSERLKKFGEKIHTSGKKKSPDIPEFELCKQVEAYMMLADELKLLKPAFIQNSIQTVQADFENLKEDLNVLTYNDLLETVEQGLENDTSGRLSTLLSEKYPLALVDEFQDTDPIQYGIFRRIYGNRKDKALFMIGDPKQAIYGFRGADIFTYLEAKSDADEQQSYHLDYNYRSNSRMIEGVNEVFNSSNSPFLIKNLNYHSISFPASKTDDEYVYRANDEAVTPFQVITIEDETLTKKPDFNEQIYHDVTNEIIELLSGEYKLNDREVQEKDIAVLVRKGIQGEEIQARLREKGIKSVLRSRTSVFSTQEASELFILLKAIQKSGYEPGIRAALSTELLGYKATDFQHLLNNEQEWSLVVEKFLKLKDDWEKKGIAATIEQIMKLFKVQQNLISQKNAERRFTNLIHLSELLEKSEREHKIEGKTLLKWYFGKLNADHSDSEDEELRLESDEDLIQISTIHASKGLQYPIVLCPFMWDSGSSIQNGDVFKFYENGRVHIDISEKTDHPNKEEDKALAQLQSNAEDVRLAYVALTRAVSVCYLFFPDYKDIYKSALASIVGGTESEEKSSFTILKKRFEECEHIQVRTSVDEPDLEYISTQKNSIGKLKAAEFQRNDLFQFKRMLSYSSLAEGMGHADYEHDYDATLAEEAQFSEEVQMDKYGFPKGANAGTCLHQIFEDMRFDNPINIEHVVKENLEYFGFSEEWILPVKSWILETLAHLLTNQKMMLGGLQETDVLKEMEFFFPVKEIEAKALWKLVRDEVLSDISDETVSGFMKGFIDLTFKFEGQFYILDYKSNYLGAQPEDYNQERLSQAMIDAGYDLQYHIYTLALHRYLQQRMPNYTYEDHFGGVFYLFLRGIEKGQMGSGVFWDKPDESLIDHLDTYFRKGEV